jgi:hypothetical protein
MRDPENMTHDEKLATIFTVGGASVLPWKMGMEYRPRYLSYPSAALAWFLATISLILFPVAFVAVPLAVRAAVRGNRLAWLAAVWALVAAVLSLTVMTRIVRG